MFQCARGSSPSRALVEPPCRFLVPDPTSICRHDEPRHVRWSSGDIHFIVTIVTVTNCSRCRENGCTVEAVTVTVVTMLVPQHYPTRRSRIVRRLPTRGTASRTMPNDVVSVPFECASRRMRES